MIDAKTKLCCVIGNPIAQSISPHLHNSLYKILRLNYRFLAFQVSDVKNAIAGFRALNITGISVTIPHKQEVMKYLDEIDQTAQKIGAVNTIINKSGKLIGTNTDWIGALKAIERKTQISGKNVALLGAGGAARALAYGLSIKGANVSVFNRSVEKANQLKSLFHLNGAFNLKEKDKILLSDIMINTTSVGMIPKSNQSPIPLDFIRAKQIVFDIVNRPPTTKLLQYAKVKKAIVIYGYEMLLYGAQKQFELFTGNKAPIDTMEKILIRYLKINK